MDFESQIEKIAKDIRDREDKEMAYELVKRLSPLLIANGVTVKTTKYNLDEQVAVKEASSVDPFKKELVIHYGISIDGLDFTEHDKVFEDKIELLNRNLNLQKDKRCEAEIERNYLAERFNQLKDENDELKQRIAELENENKNINIRIFQNEAYGNKKPTKINLNERVKVKLTPIGAEIYYHQYDDVNKKIKENCGKKFEPIMPQIDKDGYTKFQLWHFIELYGKYIGMCKPNVIDPIEIVLCE